MILLWKKKRQFKRYWIDDTISKIIWSRYAVTFHSEGEGAFFQVFLFILAFKIKKRGNKNHRIPDDQIPPGVLGGNCQVDNLPPTFQKNSDPEIRRTFSSFVTDLYEAFKQIKKKKRIIFRES